jgi:purine-cytosine permease-like protein
MYGRWGWYGIVAYLAGFVAMIPFMVIGVPDTKYDWWIGPIATRINYTDLSVFVGIPVSAIVYLILARRLDLRRERELEASEDHMTMAELEEAAARPEPA